MADKVSESCADLLRQDLLLLGQVSIYALTPLQFERTLWICHTLLSTHQPNLEGTEAELFCLVYLS